MAAHPGDRNGFSNSAQIENATSPPGGNTRNPNQRGEQLSKQEQFGRLLKAFKNMKAKPEEIITSDSQSQAFALLLVNFSEKYPGMVEDRDTQEILSIYRDRYLSWYQSYIIGAGTLLLVDRLLVEKSKLLSLTRSNILRGAILKGIIIPYMFANMMIENFDFGRTHASEKQILGRYSLPTNMPLRQAFINLVHETGANPPNLLLSQAAPPSYQPNLITQPQYEPQTPNTLAQAPQQPQPAEIVWNSPPRV